MSATSVTITATTSTGKPLAVLSSLLARRQAELGETTAASTFATAQRILISLRAATRKANPRASARREVRVERASALTAGFISQGGHPRRVAKRGPGCWERAVNLAGPYRKGEHPLVYVVRERFLGAYYIIANSEKDAANYSIKRHIRRVERFGGMARFIFNPAMQVIAVGGSEPIRISGLAKTTALRNLVVRKALNGYASGKAEVYFRDDLNYAIAALNGGQSGFDTACMSAANAIAGYLNSHIAKHLGVSRDAAFEGRIPTPFPGVKK